MGKNCCPQEKGGISSISEPCNHDCTTFTKPIQLLKKEFVLAFYVSTLSTDEKSSHRAAAGRK